MAACGKAGEYGEGEGEGKRGEEKGPKEEPDPASPLAASPSGVAL